jgi:riboflavin synthase
MFTGIIEALGTVETINRTDGNIHFKIRSPFSEELKIDQSVAHNGVCLTVTNVESGSHQVTAIRETIAKTNLGSLQTGDVVNLERCLRIGDRLDGHLVQGHIDTTGIISDIASAEGSWEIRVNYPSDNGITVKKGSICLNGISLTVVESGSGFFSVAIIPYTWEHTNLHLAQPGDQVNLEFDMVGKYLVELFNRNIRQNSGPKNGSL